MKRILFIAILTFVALAGVGFVLCAGQGDEVVGQTTSANDNSLAGQEQGVNQQDIVNDLASSLKQQGIPVKSIRIISDGRWDPPIVVECVLQSSSENDKGTPDDPIYSNLISRAVNLAQERGLDAGAVGVIFVNAQGELMSWEIQALRGDEDISSQFIQPHKLSNEAVATLLSQKFPVTEMSLNELDITLDSDGIRWVNIDLLVPDIETANTDLSYLMLEIRTIIEGLNLERGAQIAIYQIDLSYTMGEPLLRYINDLQLRHESWWQADNLTKDWFPHPPLEERS